MYTVQVLLSSYNGEEYICEQIDSILRQKDVDVRLLIRDDGSTDHTPTIIREYAKEYPNVSYIRGKNCGVVASFFRLFELSDPMVNYYALADQDDVWDEDKLKIACDKLAELEPKHGKSKKKHKSGNNNSKTAELPLLYCCSSQPTTDTLEEIPGFKEAGKELIPDFKNAIIENIARGGSLVFNQCLMSSVRIPMPKNVFMHDWWLYLVATCFGKVIYDSEAHYKYRQHSGNVLGASPNGLNKARRRLKQSKTNGGHIRRQMESFARIYKIPDDKAEAVNIILNYQKSFKQRLKGFSGKYLFRQNKKDNLIFRLLFFTNHL